MVERLSKMNMQNEYDFYRFLSEKIRHNRNEEWEKVIVLIKDEVVQGWCSNLPDPKNEEQGLIAVDANGNIFMISDGIWHEKDAQISFNFDEL